MSQWRTFPLKYNKSGGFFFNRSLLRNTMCSINYHGLEPLCAIRSWGMKKTHYFCLIGVYWTMSSQQSSDDQSALKHPYCVYKCELINITAKHSQDNQRPPLKPNTNYMFSSGGNGHSVHWINEDFKRSKQYISAGKLACPSAASRSFSRL